jgi:polyisoprenoid-binding protein YceI
MNSTNSMILFSRRRFLHFVVLACTFLALHPTLRAQDCFVDLDPTATKIEFTLDATLHTVHGSFKLKSGAMRFDPSTGSASGAIVIDALTGESGNSGRDNRMHREILESSTFSEIVFTPKKVMGVLAAEGASKLEVAGQLRLLGRDHDLTLALNVQSDSGQLQLTTQAEIPYVQWGLKNPSTFILKVSDKVAIEIRATGRMRIAAAAN